MSNLANMSPQAIAAWQRLNELWGKPIPISSSYRDPETNRRVGGAKGSQHLHGNAFDIPTAGMSPQEIDALIKAGVKAGFRGFGGYGGSVHFDVGPQRTWGPDYSSKTTPEYLKSALSGAEFSPMVSSQQSPAASVAADTMTALGKGGGPVTPDQIAQGAMAQSAGQEPEQPRGLLGNLFGNPDTMANLALAFNSMRLNPDPNLAAVLSAQMKERRAERKEAAQLNKTLAYLEKAAANGDSRAARALEYARGTGDIANALKIATEKAPKASEAEQKIDRLMIDYGVDRKTAVGIVDGVVVVNRDPVTGQAQLVNKVTGDIVGSPRGGTGQITETPLPSVEASDTFADTNVSGALGARGFGASVLNTVTDAVGLGQWADETGKAQQALQNLSARTMLGLSAEFPGRPSNLTRERIEEMTVMPGEITTGPDKALNKTREMRKLLEQAYAAASIAASGQGRYSPTQVAEASQNIGQIESLLADYIALEDALTKGLGVSQPSAQTGGGRASGAVSINGKNIPWKIKE